MKKVLSIHEMVGTFDSEKVCSIGHGSRDIYAKTLLHITMIITNLFDPKLFVSGINLMSSLINTM
jgi:hypothetical protein